MIFAIRVEYSSNMLVVPVAVPVLYKKGSEEVVEIVFLLLDKSWL